MVIPESTGNSYPRLPVRRQGVRLLLMLDLQTMFDAAQENVSISEQAHLIGRKKVQLFQSNQGFQGVSLLEEGVSGPVQELQGLQDEFDFPDASVSEFHVTMEIGQSNNVPFDPRFNHHDFFH